MVWREGGFSLTGNISYTCLTLFARSWAFHRRHHFSSFKLFACIFCHHHNKSEPAAFDPGWLVQGRGVGRGLVVRSARTPTAPGKRAGRVRGVESRPLPRRFARQDRLQGPALLLDAGGARGGTVV